MKVKTSICLILLVLISACQNRSDARQINTPTSVFAYRMNDYARLLGCNIDNRFIDGAACAKNITPQMPAWLIADDKNFLPITLNERHADTNFSFAERQATPIPHGGAWQKIMRPIDYSSMDLREQAAKLISAEGGDGCASCVGLYGTGYADLNGDGSDESIWVVEVDDWTGIFVRVGEKSYKVVGGTTAEPTALEEAENPPDPESLYHVTYEVLAAVDAFGNGKLALVVRENRYREQMIRLYSPNEDGAGELLPSPLKISRSISE